METELRNQILDANIAAHRLEARYYDKIHSEIFNWYEQRRLNRVLDSVLRGIPPDAPCLDIGAGTGNITAKLLQRGFTNVYCVDISEEMLHELQRKTGLDSGRIRCQDADSFLRDDTLRYGVAAISSVVHHLPEYRETLREIVGRLAPGGVLFITHEPCAPPRNRSWMSRALETAVRKADFALYVARYLALVAAGRLKFLGRDCHLSDYHTGERLVEPSALAAFFVELGAEARLTTYAVARSAPAAALLQGIAANAYEIIVRKPLPAEARP